MDSNSTDSTDSTDSAVNQVWPEATPLDVRRDAMYMALDYHGKRTDITLFGADRIVETASIFETYLKDGTA